MKLHSRLVQRVVTLFAIIALAVSVIPLTSHAQPSTPRGMVVINNNDLNVATQAGEDAISIPLDDWSSVTPSGIEQYLSHPLRHVYFRTAGNQDGYSYQWVQSHFEGPRADGRSWANLVLAHPEINWVLVIGNEPTVDWNTDAWSQRWWMIAVYKELALNQLGHVDQAWRQKYPDMQWGVGIGTTYSAAMVHLQWTAGSDLGAGGIRDYYDMIATHLYGESSLSESNDLQSIYQYLLSDSSTKAILVNELGIHTSNYTMSQKAAMYRDFINSQPQKVVGVTPFMAGHYDSFLPYSMDQPSYGVTLGDHGTSQSTTSTAPAPAPVPTPVPAPTPAPTTSQIGTAVYTPAPVAVKQPVIFTSSNSTPAPSKPATTPQQVSINYWRRSWWGW